MPIAPGTRLGSYVVQDFLGQGAMGVVYRAYHASLERPAAVKVLQGLAPDADSVARFRREAQSIGRMRHPNVLNVFDYGEFEGSPYMVVEFVEGGSLAGRLKQSPIDREAALRYLSGIGDALDYAHSLGIVHRDVKPANVLIGSHDAPILADFGLAKLLQGSSVKSMTGVTTGTPAYMAPEQVTGSQVGPAADRYSLAVMAYEMLTGSLPFSGDNVLEVLYAHVHREPEACSKLNPSLPAKVDDVVLRGMAKDPAARWESCASFVAALKSSLGEATPAAIAAASTIKMAPPIPVVAEHAVAAVPVAPAAAATVAVQPPSRRRSRRTILFAIGAVVLLLLLLTGGLLVYGATRPPTLAVTPAVVHPGDHVLVTAHHVPANQGGAIQFGGPENEVGFRASAGGDVGVELVVPRDTGEGDYFVRICWSGSCHASAIVRVLGSVASASASASPSPSTTPTPGTSPHPTTSPTRSPALSPHITVAPSTVLPNNTVTVAGSNFTPHEGVSMLLRRTGAQDRSLGSGVTDAKGSFTKTGILIPAGEPPGTATIIACDTSRNCAFATITIA